jgi:nickel/cobalt exporter
MAKILALVLSLCIVLIPAWSVAGDNPFVSKETAKKPAAHPSYLSEIYSKISQWQHKLNKELSSLVREVKTSGSPKTFLTLILISFFYGVIHSAGPGHGKTIAFSYFLSRKENIRKGILMGGLIALLHALSAVLIVLIIYLVLKQSYIGPFESISHKIKIVSYCLITLTGAVLLIKSILDFRNRNQQSGEKDLAPHPAGYRNILPVALAVGIVPCPGAVIIMLFCMSLDMVGIGLVLSLFMALGMAVTISGAGVLSIASKKRGLRLLTGNKRARLLFEKSLEVVGSLLMLFFGLSLLALSL